MCVYIYIYICIYVNNIHIHTYIHIYKYIYMKMYVSSSPSSSCLPGARSSAWRDASAAASPLPGRPACHARRHARAHSGAGGVPQRGKIVYSQRDGGGQKGASNIYIIYIYV